MQNKIDQFKRANFFSGLMATPKFWNDMVDYNLKKEWFYNLIYSGPGVVPGVMDELKVAPVTKKGGGLSLVINRGFAIDRQGRGLFLYEPVIKVLDYKKYKLPTTIYVSVQYDEKLDEFYQNQENAEYQGYQKKVETASVELSSDEPDEKKLELARIHLEEEAGGGIKKITEPDDIANPGPNQIDFRFSLWSRPVKQGLSPYFKRYLVEILEDTRNVAISSYDSVNLSGLRDLQTLSLTAKMLVQCGDVSLNDSINILYPLFDINNHIIQEMLDYERSEEKRIFSTKESFNEYRSRISEMGDLIKYFENKFEDLDKILKCHRQTIDCLRNIFVTRKITLDDIALYSEELPRVLVIGRERYSLVEFLDFNDHETEKNHDFKNTDTKDFSTSKLAFTYPDGNEVSDTVKIYVGGSVSFTIRNLIKKRKMLLIRRTDIFRGNYKVDVAINGKVQKQLIVDSQDTKNRWRNLAIGIDESVVTKTSVECAFIMSEGGRDNFGKIWIYQEL